jgi:hypothetical protein
MFFEAIKYAAKSFVFAGERVGTIARRAHCMVGSSANGLPDYGPGDVGARNCRVPSLRRGGVAHNFRWAIALLALPRIANCKAAISEGPVALIGILE